MQQNRYRIVRTYNGYKVQERVPFFFFLGVWCDMFMRVRGPRVVRAQEFATVKEAESTLMAHLQHLTSVGKVVKELSFN